MKRLMLSLGTLLFSLAAIVNTAYAGSLNEQETAIVEAAREVYEYDGKRYQVDPTYINKLIEYLSMDHVDLSVAEKDLVLATVYDYIELGVKDGYLIVVEDQTEQGKQDDITVKDPKDDRTDTDHKDIKQEDKLSKETTSEDEPVADKETPVTETIGDSKKPSDTAASNIIDSVPSPQENASVDSTGVADDISNNETPNVTPDPTDLAPTGMSETTTDHIIKNTGFNLNITLITIVGMGILMLVSIIVTRKNNYFALKDE